MYSLETESVISESFIALYVLDWNFLVRRIIFQLGYKFVRQKQIVYFNNVSDSTVFYPKSVFT